MPNELLLSADGSHTLVSEQFGVTYHSKHGSIQETQTVFIEAGLEYQTSNQKTNLRILEMGFGTGLNAFMTLLATNKNKNLTVDYHTLEAYPIRLDTANSLNYSSQLSATEREQELFMAMHKADSAAEIQLSDQFLFTKHIAKLEDWTSQKHFDIIYYDAFGPGTQEHLWEEAIMQKLYGLCGVGAVLVTYCAKGSFKRALKAAGFSVEGIPGPIGKREMTRAIKA